MPNLKKDLLQSLKTLALALILSIGVSYVYAWTGPTATPPNANSTPPINASGVNQVKSGGLGVTAFVADTAVITTAVITTSLKIGDTSAACSPAIAGTMRFNSSNSKLEYCDGSGWVSIPPSPTTMTFSATPASIAYNTSSTLTWSSVNTTSCTASNGWSGAKAVSGSQSTGNLTLTTNYSLSCSGAVGTAGPEIVTVTVAPPPCIPPTSPATFNSSQNNWAVPTCVTSITVQSWGGGGGGGVGQFSGGGGGGAGGQKTTTGISVIPGDLYNIVIGSGGAPAVVLGPTVFGGTTQLVKVSGGAVIYSITGGSSGGESDIGFVHGGDGGAGGPGGNSGATGVSYGAGGAGGSSSIGTGGSGGTRGGGIGLVGGRAAGGGGGGGGDPYNNSGGFGGAGRMIISW
ncbi:MAG: hypothetical protein AAB507_02460 [Patescibacteria group bacterium]